MKPLLLVALALAGHLAGPAGASRLHLHTSKTKTVTGKAVIVTRDVIGEKAIRWLKLRTPYGENVLVLEGQTSDFSGIHSGDNVAIAGVWLSRGAGGVRAVSGYTRAESTYCFVGTGLQKVTSAARHAAKPMVAVGPHPGVPTEATPAAAAAANELIPKDARGMTINSAAPMGVAPNGKAVAAPAALPPAKYLTNQLISPDLRTIIIPLEAKEASGAACPGTAVTKCGSSSPCNLSVLKSKVFQELNTDGDSIGGSFNKCSFGKTKFNQSNSFVADIVTLPCSGTSNGVSWTFSKCDFDDFNGWAEAADEILAARAKTNPAYDLSKYWYRVYLIPPSPCFWVGLGYVGCDGSYTCRAWIGGDFWTTTQAVVHEMGHNMFQGHSGQFNDKGVFDEYFDATDPMGFCCGNRCSNVAHGWQMGWYSVQQLDPEHLPPGTTVTVKLAPAATVARAPVQSGIRINATWLAKSAANITEPLFVGYRTKSLGTPDNLLDTTSINRVHIYTAPIQNTWDAQMTTYKGAIAYNKQCTPTLRPPCWMDFGDLRIRATATASTGATVTVCRKITGGQETRDTCIKKIDGDCNGMVNTTDPACVKLLTGKAVPIKRLAKL